MTKFTRFAALAATVAALSGCLGGFDFDDDDDFGDFGGNQNNGNVAGPTPDTGLSPLYAAISGGFATVETATTGANITRDANGEVAAVSNVTTGTNVATLARASDGNVILSIDDAQFLLSITNGEAGQYLVSQGDNPRVEILTTFAGNFSGAYALETLSQNAGSVGYFVVGDLTNPSQLSGTAEYGIKAEGLGVRTVTGSNQAMLLDLDGSGTVTADFKTSAIGGSALITRRNDGVILDTSTFTFNGTADNSSFSGTANLDCPAGVVCVSNSTFSGGFYGPSGAEVAGTGLIDTQVTVGANPTERTVGSLVFQGTKQLPTGAN